MREAVQKWIESGAEVQAGLRLLSLYAKTDHLARLIALQPTRYKNLLTSTLCRLSGATLVATTNPTKPRLQFREQWPFLSNPDCPLELKILAADKITAYHTYVESHQKLFDCTDTDTCFLVAENLIKSFAENRKIIYEFTYYSEHNALFGQHPIFKEMQELTALRKLNIVDLIARQKNITSRIWRAKNEIKKNNKPQLRLDREARIQREEAILREICKLIETYRHD